VTTYEYLPKDTILCGKCKGKLCRVAGLYAGMCQEWRKVPQAAGALDAEQESLNHRLATSGGGTFTVDLPDAEEEKGDPQA
jgi:hypothetical protein